MRIRDLSSTLRRVANLRAGEGGPVFALICLSLFNGVVVAFFFAAANARFLSQWQAEHIPLAYITSGVVGLLVHRFFYTLGKRFPPSTVLPLAFLLAALATTGLATAAWLSDSRAVSLLLFLFVNPVMALLDLAFWAVALRLFDASQGKRLFGLIGSGETLMAVAGALTVLVVVAQEPEIAARLLPVIAAIGSLLALAGLLLLVRRYGQRLDRQQAAIDAAAEEPDVGDEGETAQHRHYLRLLSAMAVCAVCTTYFIDFGFLSHTQLTLGGQEAALVRFIAIFFAAYKLAEQVMRWGLTKRLIRWFGFSFALLSMPVILAILSVIAMLLAGEEGARMSPFFIAILGTKVFERAFRRSLFDPSLKVLYQPLPDGRSREALALLDGRVVPGGFFLCGLVLAAFVLLDLFLGALLYLQVAVLAIWFFLGLRAFREYRSLLLEALSVRGGRAILPSPVEVMKEELRTAEPEAVRYSLNVLEKIDLGLLEEMASELLQRGSAVRRDVLARIGEHRLAGALPAVMRIARADPDRESRAVAGRTLERLQEVRFNSFDPVRVTRLAGSDEAAERQMACICLTYASSQEGRDCLSELLWDKDPAVQRSALLAAGRTGKPEFWGRLIDQLATGAFSKAATSALISIGEPVLASLEFGFRRYESRPEVQRRILKIYERIGGPEAERLLADKISYPSRGAQRQALISLSVLGHRLSGEKIYEVRQRVEETVDRITWYLACLRDLGPVRRMKPLLAALEWERTREVEHVFFLLGLICEPRAVELMRGQLVASRQRAGAGAVKLMGGGSVEEGGENRAFALQVAEVVLPAELRGALLPLLEDLPPSKMLERLADDFPQESLSPRRRLRDILRRRSARVDSWTRASAIRAWMSLVAGRRSHRVPDELVANLFSADPMIRELTAWSIRRLDPRRYEQILGRLREEERRSLERKLGSGGPNGLDAFSDGSISADPISAGPISAGPVSRSPVSTSSAPNGPGPNGPGPNGPGPESPTSDGPASDGLISDGLDEGATGEVRAISLPASIDGGRPLLIFEGTLLLRRTPIFSRMPDSILSEMAARTREVHLDTGQALFHEGDPGQALFVVVRGRIRAFRGDTTLSFVEQLGILGEIAAVETGERSASAEAVEPTHLLRIDRNTVQDLMANHLEIVPGMVRIIAERHRRG